MVGHRLNPRAVHMVCLIPAGVALRAIVRSTHLWHPSGQKQGVP